MSSKNHSVSLSVIRRLPRYYRFLAELLDDGVTRISSKELSERMGLTASQIRQDLNCFGGFGQQGYGYNVEALEQEIGRILGLDRQQKTILLGAGNLGRAIITHMDFEKRGFKLIGIFDKNPELVGQKVGELAISEVTTLSAFCHSEHPTAAILCIPKDEAFGLANTLVELGIIGFWNFSHYDLAIQHRGIVVENVHLGDSLMTLCYRINESLND